jgi:DNA-binding transcriptional LysR family regulator
MITDLNAIAVFAAVAELRSFRAAADRLGVTRSAVSQSIRRLEARLGIALVRRTTRSVSLTEAGEELYSSVAPAMAEMEMALDAARERADQPRGQLRLAVSSIAERFLSGSLLASFAAACPEVRLDITVTDEEFDIVAEGYDAAVRLGEVIARDMIAIPVSGDQRQLAVCAPSYLKRNGMPEHPRDLAAHRCIGWRPAPDVAPYRWEFAEGGREFDVAVEPEITTNDMDLMIRLAVAGAGITFGLEDTFQPWLDRRKLVRVLEDFCPTFPGFFLYFPSRRNLAPKLRALIDHVGRERRQQSAHRKN